MSEYIAFDSHKRYSLVEREDVATGKIVQQVRLTHAPGAVRRYLAQCAPGTAVALEATGNWYWIVEEIEQAGLQPRLVHPRKAKLMMGLINKTDKLDVHGLNRLQRNGTLPTVWIPPRPLRDLRELTRTRAGAGRTAHAAEESPDGHAGQVRGAAERVQRRVWKERAGRTGGADRTDARADALGLQAVAGADRFSGSADSAARAAAGGFGGGHAGDGAADDAARDCRDSGRYHRAGNRLHWPLPGRPASGQLCRNHPAGTRQRRPRAVRPAANGREPLSEVGVCGGRQLGGRQSPALSGAARQPTLWPPAPAQGTPQSHWSSGAPSGRGGLSRAAAPRGVPGSGSGKGLYQRGVSATLS